MTGKWDRRFLRVAKEVASWSKDPSKQIGAVYVSGDRRILATGYNGFPRGIEDSDYRYEDRETKYKFVAHAEMNGIYNATYNGQSLKDSTCYVWGLPVCSECAKGLIQVGVTRVVMSANEIPDNWRDSFSESTRMFREVGIEWRFILPNEVSEKVSYIL